MRKNSLSPDIKGMSRAVLSVVIVCAFALAGCQMPGAGGSASVGKINNPCVVLALPASGPYAPWAAKIKKGASIAVQQQKRTGMDTRLETVNTESPDWIARIEALPEMCAVVGGPIQDKAYIAAKKSGILQRRVFFPFVPNLQSGDEGQLAWRFFPNPQDQIDALVRLVTDEMNIRTYGSFYPSDSYGPRMSSMLEKTLAKRHISLQKASYNPSAPATWSGALKPLINPATPEGGSQPVPQTMFEALFLPDSWKHMDMLTTSLLYNGEDRILLLGTTLWEASLSGKPVPKAAKYELAVFPGAWDRNRAPAALNNAENDFWVALGYDFINFAVNLGFDRRPTAAEVLLRAQKSSSMIRGMAPITWDASGHAHQNLYLFQIGANGIKPVNADQLRQLRAASVERAALRMQNGAETPEVAETGETAATETPQAARQAEAVPAAPAPAAPVLGTVPQPSYKLRLPTKK